MKTIDHFAQNRPVHLARRDVYFERAVELLRVREHAHVPEIRTHEYEAILFLLRVARQQCRFAIRKSGENEKDEQFVRFISLLSGNVKAILSMLNLKGMVESSEGSIFSFLGGNQASVALQAEEYQRRATDIVRSIHNTLRLAEEPFLSLKAENSAASTVAELERYHKAREHFSTLVKEGRHHYQIAHGFRKITHS